MPGVFFRKRKQQIDETATAVADKSFYEGELPFFKGLGEEEIQQLLHTLQAGIWSFDCETQTYTFCTEGITRITGIAAQSFLQGSVTWINYVAEEDQEVYKKKQKELLNGNPIEHEYRITLEDGTVKWIHDHTFPTLDERGKVIRISGFITDIDHYKQLIQDMNHISTHDYLTKLPNRFSFQQQIATAIHQAHEKGEKFAIFKINLDRFKYINDQLNHEVGDQVLIEVTKRLTRYGERYEWFISRVGSDEFAFLLPSLSRLEDVQQMAKDVMELLSEPITVNEYEIYVTTCIGITIFPHDGHTEEVLRKNVDAALHRAKELGISNYYVYTHNLNAESYKMYTLEHDMRKALKNREFHVYYQPKVDITTNDIIGAEALIRWEHPIWGIVSPSEFISISEENGLIVEIGDYVIEEVCRQLREWKDCDHPLVPISVNISPKRFLQKNLKAFLFATLRQYNIEPQYLELEITENSLFHNPEAVGFMIGELREWGIKFALDDFGTGFSSLMHIRNFQIDTLKVDRSFIRDLENSDKDKKIIEMLIHLAKGLEINLVIEGVETKQQLALLKDMGSHYVQGYLYSKPVPVQDFSELIVEKNIIPGRKKKVVPAKERRRFYRMDVPVPFAGALSIVRIKEKELEMGKMKIVVDNIGFGGIRFSSHLHMPVRDDVLLEVEMKLLGYTLRHIGKLVWKEERDDGFYMYGMEFILEEKERHLLTKVVNQVTMTLQKNQKLLETELIEEGITMYLQKIQQRK
ncbi:EAL domain-containing protein [Priestia koreensis]|uniref:EAL domain-containing protein n=1 Tax=Priestia koreensis TaxID=284581 RepID=UPI00345B02D6